MAPMTPPGMSAKPPAMSATPPLLMMTLPMAPSLLLSVRIGKKIAVVVAKADQKRRTGEWIVVVGLRAAGVDAD